MAKGKLEPEFLERLRKQAEQKIKKPKGNIVPLRPGMDLARIVEELKIHQIELEMQNEQLRKAQAELEESRHKYADLFDFAPIGYFVLDKDCLIDNVNLTGSTLLGIERGRLIKKHFFVYVEENDRDIFYSHQRKVFKDGESAVCELKLTKKDGAFIYAHLISDPVKDADGNIVRCRTAVTDITDITKRKKTEEMLKRYELLARHSRDIILFIRRRDGRIIEANEAAAIAYGFSRDELLSMNIHDLRTPESRILTESQMDAADSSGIHFETVHRRKDASTFPVEVSSRGIAISDERVLLSIIRDITERKRIEEVLQNAHDALKVILGERTADLNDAVVLLQDEMEKREQANESLKQSEQRYRSLVVATAQIIWTTNPHGEVIDDLPEWREFTGQSLEDIKGWGWTSALHPDDVERTKAVWSNSVRTCTVYDIEYRVRRHDGQYRYFAVRGAPVLNNDGSIREWVGTCTDITERKQGEEKIQQDALKLRSLTTELLLTEERERRKVAEALHDSIGPLLSFSIREIGGLEKSAPKKLTHSLEEVKSYINDAIKQTRSLTFDLSPAILYDLGLEAAIEDLAGQFSKGQKVRFFFEDSGEPKPLTDEVKILLYRSVRELLVNAIKHAEAKTIRISLARTDGNIEIIIKDNGKGFDAESFENRTKKSGGLGLFSIRERLTHIGGQVNIESKQGKGTKVRLLAPLELTKNKVGEPNK